MNAGHWVTNLLGRTAPGPDRSSPGADELSASVRHLEPTPKTAAVQPNTIARLIPGTQLREGIDRILLARTGALVVLGYDEAVERICDGGFDLDVEFSPTRLRELSKMDGAVVLSTDGARIRRANVHLVPDPTLPTAESGTRHKAAERTAAHTGYPVVSVSRSTGIVTVYTRGGRHLIQPSDTILTRANQAMATLERYRSRLDELTRQLSLVELEDYATLRDVLTVVHCLELIRRVAREIDSDVRELGVDGRQLALQLAEVVGNTETLRRSLVRDYLRADPVDEAALEQALTRLAELLEVELLELANLAAPLGFPTAIEALDSGVSPRGYRLLAEIPRVSPQAVEPLVAAFESLPGLLAATTAELAAVAGVDAALARQVREGLSRLAESGSV
ncbi:DNA integrity scanning diadenylate cyclase DisA [Nocardia blacklockiae]|uniref:DNA integrity scanning diadenylate cyclase DisA n=1 Tax=Nocardia blacklockiae TaxID=480036 RepID=UPI001895C331|nr:DNA integrity scanning diadenylate cyclase DisA [Nocardia blacklockiae]MBF6173159.1 DNA integrity scanning protein DisA [Nocardia blacklockiae]